MNTLIRWSVITIIWIKVTYEVLFPNYIDDSTCVCVFKLDKSYVSHLGTQSVKNPRKTRLKEIRVSSRLTYGWLEGEKLGGGVDLNIKAENNI